MHLDSQNLYDIYRSCDEAADYLDVINETEKKDEIMYYTLKVGECLSNIRAYAEYIGISLTIKNDNLHKLERNIQQLEFDFEED